MILEFFKSLLLFPIKWFWKNYQLCKETNNMGKMIFLFFVSLSGVALFGLLLISLVGYILTKHLGAVMAIAAILWGYAAVRDKYFPKQQDTPAETLEPNQQLLREQADKGYPIMRNIIYQTLKDTAVDIGGKVPRVLGDIEMPEEHYILTDKFCFYQFRLAKEDIRIPYSQDDLNEFKFILQNAISLKVQSGAFPSVHIENYRDKYGNWHDSVTLDTIEDVGNIFILQAIFMTPDYADYLHQKKMHQETTENTSGGFTTGWNDKR